jgi:mannose-6-phosphate isomerase
MGGNKPAICKLKGVIRSYDWGGTEFLSNLLSLPNPEKKPMAEYWLGAHDSDSSIVVSNDREILLNRFIDSDKERILGATVSKRFGRLPFLLKILDVNDMLSIQVHPSKHTAEVEFARENKEKIPLGAANRNYKDDNHKPELMVALSDFWLLHGFKTVEKIRSTLLSIPELKSLLDIFNATGYDQLYKTVMEMPQQAVNEMLYPLLKRVIVLYQKNELKKNHPDFWAARAALEFNKQPITPQSNIDRGIFSIYFFNLLNLNPGEGIFQDAGLPHAYLEGQNVEIMANSDNVLRGGLTAKHIDVKELMKNIKFEETIPDILHPQLIKDHEQQYKTAAPDFKLSRFQLNKADTTSFQSATAEIVIVINGNMLLSSETGVLELRKGESAFIVSHQKINVKPLSDTDFFRASVPVHSIE